MSKIFTRFYQMIIIIKYVILKIINIIFFHKTLNTWLISERGIDAHDNGYIFYEYLKKNHPNICVKYIISNKSNDRSKINSDDIIRLGSLKHYFYYMNAEVLISSHIMGYSPNMRIFFKLNKLNFFKPKGKQIFLQHGIINNYLKELDKKNLNVDMFISGAFPEYEYLKKSLGFGDDVLKYTGLARYDMLKNNNNNTILLMPTWRKYLFYSNKEDFKNSNYYKIFNSFINNDILNEFLENNKIKLLFYPHHEIQKFIKTFNCNTKNVIICEEQKFDIQELIRNSKMLITDYSSVFYDFAYMNKQIIYYQFDYDLFYTKHYKEGYLNFEKDGFGPVIKEEDKLVDYIINNFKKKNSMKYSKKINEFFKYRDNNNCERIFNEIMNIL